MVTRTRLNATFILTLPVLFLLFSNCDFVYWRHANLRRLYVFSYSWFQCLERIQYQCYFQVNSLKIKNRKQHKFFKQGTTMLYFRNNKTQSQHPSVNCALTQFVAHVSQESHRSHLHYNVTASQC